jgi:1,2-phenylacetyl-CoA epoxidase catalytic subunit
MGPMSTVDQIYGSSLPPRHDEESRGLLKRILEGQAYRQLTLCNIRGHGIKFLPEVADKSRVAQALLTSLEQFGELERLYRTLEFGDVVSAVRHKMERVPYPATRMELAVCLFLCERVSWHALDAYVESKVEEFAAIARLRHAELRPLEAPEDPAFAEFCADETNRPLAQQLFNRWLSITLLSLGRPDSPGDARAVALKLRSRSIASIVGEYLAGLEPFLRSCGLVAPDGDTIGVELPKSRGGKK